MRHELRTWPSTFGPTWEGQLAHTVRRMDRPFSVGDTVLLREYDQARDPSLRYTGRSILATITFVSPPGSFWLPDEVCVLSLKVGARFLPGSRRLDPSLDPVAS